MSPEILLQFCVAGVTYGVVYGVVAIGFTIIYNTTGIINFAQGEFLMLGAMTAVSLHRHLPLPLAIAGAVAATMAVGALIEVLFIRWLHRPSVLRMIMITIGVSILVREAALHVWDEKSHALPHFTGDAVSALALGGAKISPQALWVVGVCGVMVLALSAFFRATRLGRQMRACALNRDAARLCGINARNMVTFSFVLSAGMGALAGCVVSPITYVQYDSGTGLAIKGFTAAILGGLGSTAGAAAGGLVLGLLESFSVWALPAAYKDAVAIAIMLGVLFVRPSGILGSAEAARLREH
ncbi:MAG TPA: branched-chain amino acid ABC transporter permease [bacterium]